MKIYKQFVMLFLMTVLSGCRPTLLIQKNLNSIEQPIDTISILFPEIEYSEKSGDVKKIESAHSVFVSNNVVEIIKSIIDSGYFISKFAIIVSDSLLISKWAHNQFSSSKNKYNHMRDSLRTSRYGKKTVPLVSDLRYLVDKAHTRYFIYITGISYGTSEETKRYDVQQEETFKLFYDRPFVYEHKWYGLQLQIVLADSRSNEILWYSYNDERDSNYDPLDKGRVNDLCSKLLMPQ
jgi:hypothetical protein